MIIEAVPEFVYFCCMTDDRQVCLAHRYEDIISLVNLLSAWREFHRGKGKKRDVQEFQQNLFDNILVLRLDLSRKSYIHGSYHAFNISDPKPRNIHKATVRDRLLHHAIYQILYPLFDRKFIADSFSCRKNKGTHKALERFRKLAYKASRNNTRTLWVLKCDIQKFFASIDHRALMEILRRDILDTDAVWLVGQVVSSFCSEPGKGLPLGNLTSQLLVNVYLNEFDQFIKHEMKEKYYIRYADDFVIMNSNRGELENLVPLFRKFLSNRLRLTLHSEKLSIRTLASGVDFLGWVHFPNHRVLRTATKKRMFRNLQKKPKLATVESYLGMLTHGNTHKLRQKLKIF